MQELADERGGSEPGVSQEVGPIKTAIIIYDYGTLHVGVFFLTGPKE